MRCQIPTIPDEDLDLAVSAGIGAESRVSVSYSPAIYVADVEQDGTDLGTLIKDKTFRAPTLESVGRDLQLICSGPVLSDEQIVVTFNVKLAGAAPAAKTINAITEANPAALTTSAVHGLVTGDTVTISGTNTTPSLNGTHVVTVTSTTAFTVAVNVTDNGNQAGSVQADAAETTGTAVATFNPPATAQDDSFNFPPGLGVDVIPAGGDSTLGIRSVVSIASVAGGRAGNKFILLSLPDRASYTEIMCVTDKTIPSPAGKPLAIACRYDGARWVKKGRSEPPTAEFKAKLATTGDGLPRINGHRVTVMVETRKDDRILTDRIFLTGWRPVVNLNIGDGDAEAEASASGMFEIFAAFV